MRQRQDLSIPILDLSGASRFETAVLSPTRAAPPARGVASELKGREALIVAFGASREEHAQSHRRKTFQPMLRRVLEFCENGNEEIACETAWSGRAYSEDGWAVRRAGDRCKIRQRRDVLFPRASRGHPSGKRNGQQEAVSIPIGESCAGHPRGARVATNGGLR